MNPTKLDKTEPNKNINDIKALKKFEKPVDKENIEFPKEKKDSEETKKYSALKST